MQEQALLLGRYQSISGVFTPASNSIESHASTALICLTAGLIHHVGPHRLHVLLARSLAEQGISTLRFDFSGIGDSTVRSDDIPAQDIPVVEINEAITELEKRGYTRFILFGICSGAVQAAKAANDNPKVAGLILVNTGSDPSNTEASPEAAIQYYLKRSLWNPQAWKNLFTGRVKYRELFSTMFQAMLYKVKGKDKNQPAMVDNLKHGIQPFIEQGTSILMVLSDRHAQFYDLYRNTIDSLQGAYFKISVHAEADHLFTSLSAQQDLIKEVCQWSDEITGNNR